MGDGTKIEWSDMTWNPVRGCSRVSPGCELCYAEKVAHRYSGEGQAYDGLTVLGKKGPRWSGKIMLVPHKLDEPIRKRRARLVFVNSMSDLFHPKIPFEYIAAVHGAMALSPQHTFQVLTKRPERALEFQRWYEGESGAGATNLAAVYQLREELQKHDILAPSVEKTIRRALDEGLPPYPLPNVWLGTSVEDQKAADLRLPQILECAASVIWVSYEPALGPVSFAPWMTSLPGHPPRRALDWIVIGGESDPHGRARPFDIGWARSVIQEAARYREPFRPRIFVKQLGAHPYRVLHGNPDAGRSRPPSGERENIDWLKSSKGGDWDEWSFAPELRVRDLPRILDEAA